jgi:hypothetical protein
VATVQLAFHDVICVLLHDLCECILCRVIAFMRHSFPHVFFGASESAMKGTGAQHLHHLYLRCSFSGFIFVCVNPFVFSPHLRIAAL